jgi:ABC-type sugar transport system ATPase subunit
MSQDNILELRGVTKDFPGVRAVNQVDFELKRGEVHAVIGENGAGKSTLMNILGGVLRPDAGEILVVDRPVRFANPAEANRSGIAVVFQELSLVPSLSIGENIYFNRQPRTALGFVDWKLLDQQARELLKVVNLDVHPRHLVRDLPVGRQQLVEILKALSLEPKILILDEPTSSLSADHTELLFAKIRHLRASGVSFIYISHHLPEIFQLADRVTILRDGSQIGTYSVSAVDEETLVKRMVGRELTNMYGTRTSEIGQVLFRFAKPALSGVGPIRLDLRKGEILGVAGLIGSGRTELAMEIAGITPNAKAKIELEGRLLAIRHPADAIRHGIAYMTEDRKKLGLFLSMSVRENNAAPSLPQFTNRLGFVRDREISRSAVQSRKRFSIATPSIRKTVVQLSGGNQQKVLLSMWVGVCPKVLIADEPTRGVDVGAKSEIYRHLRQLAASGVGIILISSELQEILGMSDRILVMREARFIAEFTREQASEENIILAATGLSERRNSVSDVNRENPR